ncbi:MAG: hypothetical protein SGI98_03565 [Verrucomicrobiota bacterium]|nr:hypothetical protein [Verrucomicrobiota bacterium]
MDHEPPPEQIAAGNSSIGLWFLGGRIKVARAPSPAGIGKNMAKMAGPLSPRDLLANQ